MIESQLVETPTTAPARRTPSGYQRCWDELDSTPGQSRHASARGARGRLAARPGPVARPAGDRGAEMYRRRRGMALPGGRPAGSVARWLAERIGADGHVLAVDHGTGVLDADRPPNLEVRRLDILAHELPRGAFDLVHSRSLLSNAPDPDSARAQMIAALRPDGWLVAGAMAWIWRGREQ